MNNEQFETLLGRMLKRQAETTPAEDAAVARILKRLSGPLPRQKISLWRLPTVLLDWQFAPAWPRVAALAGCAALGFVVGIAGLDRPYDQLDGTIMTASRDFGSIFEAEPLTGARP